MLEVAAVAFEFVDDFEHPLGVRSGEGFGNFAEGIEGEEAEEFADFGFFKIVAAAGDGLIECREGVTNAALADLGDDAEGFERCLDAFLFADPLHAGDEFVEVHTAEAELLAAGSNGGGDLVGLCGAENEDDPFGRFFEGLEEGVEGFGGDLVGFVDDKDFVLVASGAVADVLAEFAHFVDAAIGGGVDFDDVRGVTGGDLGAGGALHAGGGSGSFFAIEAAGEDAGDSGFSCAALAGEDVAVGDTALGDGVAEGGADVLLSDEFGERLGTVLAGDNLIRLRLGCGGQKGSPKRNCQAPGDPRHTG